MKKIVQELLILWNKERVLLFNWQDLQSDKKSAQLDLKKDFLPLLETQRVQQTQSATGYY